jgi:penicillin-binding protein 2
MSFFSRDHAWFAAFAPYQNSEIAVVVLNEHGGHGGAEAGPLAMEIIKAYFRIKKEDAMQRSPVAPHEVIPQPAPSDTLPSLEYFPREAYLTPAENRFWN